jgi:CubicO group peptidase (beta-lactamase class C family)
MSQFLCSFRGTLSVLLFTFRKQFVCTSIVYRYATLSGLLVLAACNSASNSKQTNNDSLSGIIQLPAPSSLTKAESERLRIACEKWYDSVLKRSGFNGGVVVAKKGNIVFEAYNGTAHPGNTDTITYNTAFHIASVSKTFTAMATLKLWQDGKCNIDDEYSKYFPSFTFPGVTIRTLLNHRSGLPNYVHFMENMGWDKKVNITNEDVFNFLITRKGEMNDIGTPNRRFTYCNTNFALLALLIEKLSGKKYGAYLQDSFFTPLQMNNTFVYDQTDSGKVTLSYDYRGKVISMNFLDLVYGDKNVYSTPRDLLKWDRALTSGKIFTEKTLSEAYAPYSNEKPGIRNYGLGWRMNNYPSGKKMIYHNGWWHGNNASFIRLLEDSATIIVLGNKYNHGIYHANQLSNIFGNYFGDGGNDEQEDNKTPEQSANETPAKTAPIKSTKQVKPVTKTISKKTAKNVKTATPTQKKRS